VELTENLYPNQAWKLWGFALGSLFVQAIADFYNFFPLLLLEGPPQSGKNLVARFLLSLFGAHWELKPFNFNSTHKALQRAGGKYKGIPLVFNEFQNSKNSNALVCSLYDREGYQRARTDNTLDLQKAEINATFIILSTQSISGHEAEAVLSRVVTINMDEAKRDSELIQKLQELEDKLAYFVVHCLRKIDPDKLLKEIRERMALTRYIIGASERIIQNHIIFAVCANEFYKSLSHDFLLQHEVIKEVFDDIARQQAETTSANVAKTFIQTTIALVRKGEVPAEAARIVKEMTAETRGLPPAEQEFKETLVFHLPTVLPFVRRFSKQADIAIVDEKTLAKNLRKLNAIYELERYEGKVRKVWKVEIRENQA
jgi:hypothetical protein